jgi:hypothetical protein
MNIVSKCCGTLVKLAKQGTETYDRGRMVTNWYNCTKCGWPCDIVVEKKDDEENVLNSLAGNT